VGSLAGLLKAAGHDVRGSDEHVYPPMSTYLEALHIPVLEGYTREHLETFRPDLVVVGNAAARTNPEAAAVLEMDLPYTSMPEAIYELFIKGKHAIVVTGTHGKTTTTSLMAWMLGPCAEMASIRERYMSTSWREVRRFASRAARRSGHGLRWESRRLRGS